MNCCICEKILNLCSQDVCDEIDFGEQAVTPGVHQMITYFLGNKIVIEKEFIVGENFIFPITDLNESYEFTVELYDPIGDRIVIIRDGVQYDCFKFRTAIVKKYSSVIIASS